MAYDALLTPKPQPPNPSPKPQRVADALLSPTQPSYALLCPTHLLCPTDPPSMPYSPTYYALLTPLLCSTRPLTFKSKGWRTHWNYQLAKALEFQYKLGLESYPTTP